MRASTVADRFGNFEDAIQELRRTIEEDCNPKVVSAVAVFVCLDSIARIQNLWDQVDTEITSELSAPGCSFEQNIDRFCEAIRIFRRLSSMLLAQTQLLLSCVGGPDAIAADFIFRLIGDSPERQQVALQVLSAFKEEAKLLRKWGAA